MIGRAFIGSSLALFSLTLLQPARTSAEPRVISLAQALKTAREQQPSLRQARAATDASRARVGQARAPLYPQVNASAAYQLTTANFTARPGQLPSSVGTTRAPPDFDLFNYWNFGVSATQLVWDFGQTSKRKDAAQALVATEQSNELQTQQQVAETVRVSYFQARAQKALLAVAHESLDNQERHLAQTEGFVRAGTRAEIDLAQARTDRANSRVTLINAENDYAAAKARLNQAIGVEGSTDFEVADESLPKVQDEDSTLDSLVQQALQARPEFAALHNQIRAQQYTLGAVHGSRWPALGISTAATEAGTRLDDLTWNWNAGVSLTWRLFEGGIVGAQADETRANLAGLSAQLDVLRQQVRVDVDQTRLSVRAAQAVLGAADEAVLNGRERLRLAEGRYQTGVGSGLELADAQLALSAAQAQRVQAEYNLATARSHLLRALGRAD